MGDFRFDCVFYYVSDLDRAIAFYTATLGFRLSSRDVVARFLVDDVLVELVPTSDPELLSGRGNARLAVAVEHIQGAIEKLREKGVPVSEARQVSNGQLASFQDPDGNEIVLWQYGRWSSEVQSGPLERRETDRCDVAPTTTWR
jgi:catechol 2,3-dioxygenase-like lactoylglutathione lyase family enzyme